MSHSQSSGALAQDMRQLSLSPDSDAHGETRTSTPNAIPIFYRLAMPPSDHPHQQQATNIIFVYRVVFSKAHAPGSPDGGTTTAMENARLYSKSLQRALMPLVFEHVGIPADGCGATTNGSDRIFSTRRLALGKVGVEGRKEEEEREDRVDFELDAPRGSGGRVGVVVELIDEALAPPATLGPEAAAASMSANQSQFLSSAVQAFARAQVWEGKDAVGGWRLVGKNMYFDATPEQCLGYGPFQARRGVAVPLTRDPQCLLKLAPLSRTFVVESPFVEFVERLVAPGEMRAVHSIPGDVVEYVKKVFTGSKVRYSYVSAAQREDGESRKAMRLQSWEVQKEGILRRICGFGGNAKDTKFQHIRKTAGEEEESLSVQEYFENHVFPGTKLRFPKWPLANTGSIEKPTWVPLELLWIEADQIVDELPERLPLIVSKLFTEKHADNIRKFDPESFTSLLKLDQVTAHYRIQLEEVRSVNKLVPSRPVASLNGIRQLHESHDLRLLHVEGACAAQDDDWDCGATFGKFLGALQKFGALKSDTTHLPVYNYITLSQLSDQALSRFTATPPTLQDDKKPLLFACLSGEKHERDHAYQEIKRWGDAANIPTIVVQANKFREHMDAWSKDLPRPSDKRRRAAVGYARSMSKKIRARCGCDGLATQRVPKSFRKELSEDVAEDADVPVLRLL